MNPFMKWQLHCVGCTNAEQPMIQLWGIIVGTREPWDIFLGSGG